MIEVGICTQWGFQYVLRGFQVVAEGPAGRAPVLLASLQLYTWRLLR